MIIWSVSIQGMSGPAEGWTRGVATMRSAPAALKAASISRDRTSSFGQPCNASVSGLRVLPMRGKNQRDKWISPTNLWSATWSPWADGGHMLVKWPDAVGVDLGPQEIYQDTHKQIDLYNPFTSSSWYCFICISADWDIADTASAMSKKSLIWFNRNLGTVIASAT